MSISTEIFALTKKYVKDYLDGKIGNLGQAVVLKGIRTTVDDLPTEGAEAGDLYLVGTTGDYIEYIYTTENSWKLLGSLSSDIDINDYATLTYVNEAVARKADTSEVNSVTNTVNKIKAEVESISSFLGTTALDTTGKDVTSAINELSSKINSSETEIEKLKNANKSILSDFTYQQLLELVNNGVAQEYFSIGDQITVNWKDIVNNKTYEVPLDVVKFEDVETEDGRTVPGMFLQFHYATPWNMPFDTYEAFYNVPEGGLAAGTYNVTFGENYGWAKAGKSYQFTLNTPVPAGGQLAGFRETGNANLALTSVRVYSYANNTTTTVLESAAVTEGSGGANLGTFTLKGNNSTLNSLQRISYGYNDWKTSNMRQWLNSEETTTSYVHPGEDNPYDRPCGEVFRGGFLAGFDDDFRNIIGRIKVVTAKNNHCDGDGWTVTYDKAFLPSLSEMYIQPQKGGDSTHPNGEGSYYPYWKEINGTSTRWSLWGTYPILKSYGLENKLVAQVVRLRSASRGTSNNAWNVYSSGGVSHGTACGAQRGLPVICVAKTQ